MAINIPEADYDNYAGSAESFDEVFTYFDFINVTEVVTNEDAINNSIRNILTTRIGSVPGKPDFGSNVMYTVFEFIGGGSTKDLLKNSVVTALLKWEPRISVNEVKIQEIPEYNRIIADIYYTYEILGGNIDSKTSILLQD